MKLEDKTNNNIISQAVDGFDITPSDTTVFQAAPLYIGTGNDITVEWTDDDSSPSVSIKLATLELLST